MAEYVLYPDGTVAAASWGPTGAATNHAATDDPAGAPDGDATYAQGSNSTWDYLIMSLAPMVDVVEITGIVMTTIYNNAGAGAGQEFDFGIRIGTTNYLNGAISGFGATYSTSTKSWPLNPATGAAWTKPQLDDLQIVNGTQDTSGAVDSVRVTSCYITVTYQPIPAGIAAAQGVAAQRLRRYRRPLEEMPIEAGLEILDLELMDDFSVTHPAGPDSAGGGWGATNWKRRLHQYREESIDLNAMKVTLRSRGRRGYLASFWDTAESRRSSSAIEDGVARLTTGGTLTFTRASRVWFEDPGSRTIVLGGSNQKPIAYGGMLMESSATNFLVYSSAVEGASALAALTTTAGSGATSVETPASSPLFDSGVSNYCYVITAGSPHAADTRLAWPATASISANTKVRVSIDRMDSHSGAGNALSWRLRRAIDGNYWDDSGAGSWVAGATDNTLAGSTTRARAYSKVIDVGAGATTVTFSAVALAGGTASRTHRIYHAQVEDKAWATSQIVTGAATYTRALETYTITDTTGKRALNSTGGTFLCAVIPEYTAADALAGGTDLYFFDLTYDASNWFRLYYDVSAGNLLFEIRTGGTTTTASSAWSPTRGTTYKLACRWTSADGDLGLTARTHSVFVDGVKGTDATRASDPTRTSATLYIGGNSAGAACNSNMSRILFTPERYTDAEVSRFAP